MPSSSHITVHHRHGRTGSVHWTCTSSIRLNPIRTAKPLHGRLTSWRVTINNLPISPLHQYSRTISISFILPTPVCLPFPFPALNTPWRRINGKAIFYYCRFSELFLPNTPHCRQISYDVMKNMEANCPRSLATLQQPACLRRLRILPTILERVREV